MDVKRRISKQGIILNYCGITQVKLVPKQACHKEIYEILEMAYDEVDIFDVVTDV